MMVANGDYPRITKLMALRHYDKESKPIQKPPVRSNWRLLCCATVGFSKNQSVQRLFPIVLGCRAPEPLAVSGSWRRSRTHPCCPRSCRRLALTPCCRKASRPGDKHGGAPHRLDWTRVQFRPRQSSRHLSISSCGSIDQKERRWLGASPNDW